MNLGASHSKPICLASYSASQAIKSVSHHSKEIQNDRRSRSSSELTSDTGLSLSVICSCSASWLTWTLMIPITFLGAYWMFGPPAHCKQSMIEWKQLWQTFPCKSSTKRTILLFHSGAALKQFVRFKQHSESNIKEQFKSCNQALSQHAESRANDVTNCRSSHHAHRRHAPHALHQ